MLPAKILLVEDEPALAHAIQLNLENLGYNVPAIIDSGEEALEHVHSSPPDLVLMDVTLQGKLDGIQTAERIRLDDGIPVIFLTAHTNPDTIKRAISTAPFGYLVKPFQIRELQLIIELALQNRAMERAIRESEETYRSLTELSPNAILVLSPDGMVLLANPRACELFKATSPAELVGRSALEMLAAEERQSLLAEHTPRFWSEGYLRGVELTATRLDGSQFPAELSASTVRDERGNPSKVIVVVTDNSQRNAAKQAILEQAARSDTLARVAAQINRSLDLEQVLSAVCEEVAAAFKVPGVAVTLFDAATDQISIAASQGPLGDAASAYLLPIPASLFEQFWITQGPVCQIADLGALESVLPLAHPLLQNVKTVVMAFMVQSEQLIGSINIATIETVREFNNDELSLLAAIAELASMAIAHARLFMQVAEGRYRLQTLSRQLVEVQESERRHLANELHDQVGQMLTGLQFNLEMSKVLQGKHADQNIQASQGIVREIISQVRELSLSLRPSLLDDLGLLACLDWHIERYSMQTGIRIHFSHPGLGERRFPPEIEITVFRIVQEALTNIARHAQVKEASVDITINDSHLFLKVQDRGRGFDFKRAESEYDSVGLGGMRERANLVGGKLEIHSALGQGTTIRAHIPTQNRLERRKNARNRAPGG